MNKVVAKAQQQSHAASFDKTTCDYSENEWPKIIHG